ncbi:hypothetical protein SERLA73DRAFT_80354 [Serpula lacrymans var. lacrymans S7.3]|uniref:Uncharacterized protein n=1 Tax=Serpula lacrymans var. lacrymans (strain S7.3) TaxID=936435 RepID=F8QJI3_SERL3|nr:hypothetical protein SERLA73DRAFT_80354 [Serpula lacrymans var. lacrymans S7.3]
MALEVFGADADIDGWGDKPAYTALCFPLLEDTNTVLEIGDVTRGAGKDNNEGKATGQLLTVDDWVGAAGVQRTSVATELNLGGVCICSVVNGVEGSWECMDEVAWGVCMYTPGCTTGHNSV